MNPPTYVVTGGGTGGHVFTGLAVLDAVQEAHPGARTVYIGSSAGFEARLVPGRSHAFVALPVRPLRGQGRIPGLAALGRVPWAMAQAMAALKELDPAWVLGIGGSASGPTLLAAAALGLPRALHEQNAVAGLANRLVARWTPTVFVGLPQQRGALARWPNVVVTGNPVRAGLVGALRGRVRGRQPLGTVQDPVVVLVLGGSEGSGHLNRVAPLLIAHAARAAHRVVRVVHQAGVADAVEAVGEAYRAQGIQAEVAAFFDDMTRVYVEADVALTLAGACTLAEVALAGLPSLVVPLARAADDHQRDNAAYYARRGGVVVVPERRWDGARAAAALTALLGDAVRRQRMSECLEACAEPEAARSIVAALGGR